MLANSMSSVRATAFLFPQERVALVVENGGTEAAAMAAKELLDRHGLGNTMQLEADAEIISHIKNKTDIGKALLIYSKAETYAADKLNSTMEAVAKKKGMTEYKNPLTFYRRGETNKAITSWTHHPSGADIGYMRLTPDKSAKWVDLKKKGYRILGGYTRMMGAPGESEVTLFKV